MFDLGKGKYFCVREVGGKGVGVESGGGIKGGQGVKLNIKT